MQEVDEHGQIDQHQQEYDIDGKVRHEDAVLCRADCQKDQHAVHGCRHKRAQRELSTAIADEVAQHPGSELGRCQRQRDDRDREVDSDDRHDRCGHREENLACRVCAAGFHPCRKCERAVVDGTIYLQGGREQRNRGEHLHARHQPEVGSQYFAPPLRHSHPGNEQHEATLEEGSNPRRFPRLSMSAQDGA